MRAVYRVFSALAKYARSEAPEVTARGPTARIKFVKLQTNDRKSVILYEIFVNTSDRDTAGSARYH